ncbi:hypothetical protein [Streptomyces sp. TBY4]|uniref:hypothetical protein n=1 Tax=Streptomyces sp. TBY4 TaxID=2962030 RepID=UPI0020B7CE10|nr:hypothetical protein [Streptomyces sp. TBY4]MCP3759660.1 hypothetical protein [Streptomyces sp. TBY4]
MNSIPIPDPIAVLHVARNYAITEQQAEVTLTWASVNMAVQWAEFAVAAGLDEADGEAMSRWSEQFPTIRIEVLEEAVANVTAAPAPVLNPVDRLLAEVRRAPAPALCRPASPMRTNRSRVRIR